ncbi:MAG: universal stress protein [Deltaproteobacteria bacterium]|nr:universal stress protein [Deltaproteobacteria bacterium]
MNNFYDIKPGNILCPVDFSDLSGLAIKYAAADAHLYGAKLVLMNAEVFELPRYFSGSEADRLTGEIIKNKEMVRKELADYFLKILGKGAEDIDADFKIMDTDPRDAILQTVEKNSIGLVVMGTHGFTGLSHLLLGSVAESVIHNIRVPVFTVRQKSHDFIDVTDPDALPHLEKVLCACEIDKDDRETLAYAVSVSERFNARLKIVYSNESRDVKDFSMVRERVCSWISEIAKTQCNLEPVVRKGNAADQIIALAKEEKSDLIVIGAHHRPFHGAMILGRTTDLVVRHAPAPVLVVPGHND